MTFGGEGIFSRIGDTGPEGARRMVDLCLDVGVSMFDTANVYSAGRSEEILGEALEGRQDDVLVASKVRGPTGSGPNDAGLSRHHIIRECEASLRRLRRGHIDLYQVHEWDGHTPLEETLRALDDLVSSGKVRYVGCSNYTGWQLLKALGISDRFGYSRFVSEQIHYSLQARDAENELIPAAIDQGLGVLVWSPLAGGLLSGKFRRGAESPSGVRWSSAWSEPPVHNEAKLFDIIELLVAIADGHGVSAAQVALAWLLGRPAIASVIIGARTEQQLVDNLAATHLKLSEPERASLDAVSSSPLLYPYWHQAKVSGDRLSPADLSLLEPFVRP
jgi:aryl-alcohol dehydrogenase-like predicted oxidoreductase